MANWTPEKKWIRFMTLLEWYDVNTGLHVQNWNIVNRDSILDNIPHVESWARRHIKYVNDHETRLRFKDFYFKNETMGTAHHYTKKTYAEHALAAIYRYQQD